MPKITLREAAETAHQATQYGYHQANEIEAYAFCPYCRERVTAYKKAWDRTWTLGAWTKAFSDHLPDCRRSLTRGGL